MATVAVLMPCRNAAPFVGEAISSCLRQGIDVEVIAVDDGSTDGTLEVLQSFGSAVKVIAGPWKGAPTARNIAFEASSAPYIQYLDADDVISPGKLAAQVAFLEDHDVDIVYGDWRYWFDEGPTQWLGPVQVAGQQNDPIEALLDDWWMPPLALLHRRAVVSIDGGWDPAIEIGDDHDFLLSRLIGGARMAYQPGCHSLYRRHGTHTLSRVEPKRWLTGRASILGKAHVALERDGALDVPRRQALARSYHRLARWWWEHDHGEGRRFHQLAQETDPSVLSSEALAYRALSAAVGFGGAEQVAWVRRRIGRRFGGFVPDPNFYPGR